MECQMIFFSFFVLFVTHNFLFKLYCGLGIQVIHVIYIGDVMFILGTVISS